ncbi:MAG: ROK family protein [Alphaproteobacteria bacterium]|nr:ROK family protein [Alphaproteobacteria bacterium]
MKFGLDVGGTKIEYAVFDDKQKILFRERIKTAPKASYNIAGIAALVSRFHAKPKLLTVGLPGVIDTKKGRVVASTHKWITNAFVSGLQKKLKCKVKIDNDANLFALSEHAFGAAKGIDEALFITMGTGVGSAAIANGKLVRGYNGGAGEFGFTPMNHSENYRGLFAKFKPKDLIINTLLSGGGYKRLYNAYYNENIEHIHEVPMKRRLEFVKVYADIFAYAILPLIGINAPRMVILGGGVSKEPDIARQIENAIARYFDKWRQPLVCVAKNGDSAGVFAASL